MAIMSKETSPMNRNLHGVFRNGKVELAEPVSGVRDETPVLVTFLDSDYLDLKKRGISESHAADLRHRLALFTEDWDSSEMDVYEDYDGAKNRL